MNRRHFLARSLSAGLTVGVGYGATTGARAERASTAKKPTGFFDVHLHLTQPWYGDPKAALTASDLLHWMDAHDIAQAAVLPLVSPEAFWYPVTTEFVLKETQPHRDRLIPFCCIDPRTLETHLATTKEATDVLRRYQDAGARGFGEHKPMLAIDDPLSMRLYEACSEAKFPLLFHLDNKANMDRPGLPGLANALAAFPELPFIGHGKGWWASIAGGVTQADLHVGYPRGPVAPGGAIDALMDKHHNLYGDLSSSGAHAVLRDPQFGQQFLERRADRLLFGTDYYDPAQTDLLQFELLPRFELPQATVAAIARENAQRLLRVA